MTAMVILSAVGLIITPIYLLSMLRQLFYGNNKVDLCIIGTSKKNIKAINDAAVCFGTSCVLPDDSIYEDAKPREIFIAFCFLALIIGIGFYPKLATNLYDVKTIAVNQQIRQSYVEIAQNNSPSATPELLAKI